MLLFNKNQNSLIQITIIVDLLKDFLKEVFFSILISVLYKSVRILFNRSKPSLIEYKNRAELVYHFSVCVLKIESPLKFLIIYLKYRSKNINQNL